MNRHLLQRDCEGMRRDESRALPTTCGTFAVLRGEISPDGNVHQKQDISGEQTCITTYVHTVLVGTVGTCLHMVLGVVRYNG